MTLFSPEPEPSFSVATVASGDLTRVVPAGELDLATVSQLGAKLDDLLQVGARRIVLDLRELTFMGSSGLRLILKLDAIASRDGLEFGLISGSEPIQRIFRISGMADRLPFQRA